jgi:hypothetical protein
MHARAFTIQGTAGSATGATSQGVPGTPELWRAGVKASTAGSGGQSGRVVAAPPRAGGAWRGPRSEQLPAPDRGPRRCPGLARWGGIKVKETSTPSQNQATGSQHPIFRSALARPTRLQSGPILLAKAPHFAILFASLQQ